MYCMKGRLRLENMTLAWSGLSVELLSFVYIDSTGMHFVKYCT